MKNIRLVVLFAVLVSNSAFALESPSFDLLNRVGQRANEKTALGEKKMALLNGSAFFCEKDKAWHNTSEINFPSTNTDVESSVAAR